MSFRLLAFCGSARGESANRRLLAVAGCSGPTQ